MEIKKKLEKKIRKCIDDDNYFSILEQISSQVATVWSSESPRIINDYTDHGIKHCERVFEFALGILESNDGKELTTIEYFLLFTSIFLHDIGMQCDFVKFPDILEISKSKGANFEHEFSAKKASSYSLEEQKAIRNNHHIISAAWIDYSFQSGESAFGKVIQTISEEYISDLMDICKFHSKLPISQCPINLKFDPTQRKQLLAAVLRLADEMDIDSNRVNMETIHNFSIDPQNSFYWWLHNKTKIILQKNIINITIRLNPKDFAEYRRTIHNNFISEFHSKNRPVFEILQQNSIPISMSMQSDVVEDSHSAILPDDIVLILNQINTPEDPLLELANEIGDWLKAIRYEISEIKIIGNRIAQFYAFIEVGSIRQTILVWCLGGEITYKDVDSISTKITFQCPQGWLISDKRISSNAINRIPEDKSIELFTLSQFLEQKVWGNYFNFLETIEEKEAISKLFVDLNYFKETYEKNENEADIKPIEGKLENLINDWLSERGSNLITLLGEFGTGKTWFCKYYAYKQLQRYKHDPVNQRLPLLITLRSYTKSLTSKQLINDVLLEQYKLPFIGSVFNTFEEMNRKGKILLILDGFDEMARQVDYNTIVENFWELAKLINQNSKVILTSRSEYFRWHAESEKVFTGKESSKGRGVLPSKFEIVNLKPFGAKQIRKAIMLRLGETESIDIIDTILADENLVELASKPLLIDLLINSIDEINADLINNISNLYLYTTNNLLLRNIRTARTFTSTSDKLYFLMELAWEMIIKDELQIHYKDIPKRINTYFEDRIEDRNDLDYWDFDLRNQTMLHRNSSGYYEFEHKSFVEYFVALKLSSEICCLKSEFTQAYCESSGTPCKFPKKFEDIEELKSTFGSIPLTNPKISIILKYLSEMLDKEKQDVLIKLLSKLKKLNFQDVGYIGSNIITLLKILDTDFKNMDFSDFCLQSGDFSKLNLSNSNFMNADLEDSTFIQSDLRNSNFKNTLLSNSDFSFTDLRSVNFDGANFNQTKFNESFLYSQIAISENLGIIAAGSKSTKEIHLWNINNKIIRKLDASKYGVIWRLEFSSDDKYLIAVGRGKFISIWDTNNWEELSFPIETPYINDFVFYPKNNYLYVSNSFGSIKIISLEEKEIIREEKLSESAIHCFDIDLNNDLLVVGLRENDPSIVFLSLDSFNIMNQFNFNFDKEIKKIHRNFISKIKINQNSNRIFIGIGFPPMLFQLIDQNKIDLVYKPEQQIYDDFGDHKDELWDLIPHQEKEIIELNYGLEKIGLSNYINCYYYINFDHSNRFLFTPGSPQMSRIIDLNNPANNYCFDEWLLALVPSQTEDTFYSVNLWGGINIYKLIKDNPLTIQKCNTFYPKINCKDVSLQDTNGLDDQITFYKDGQIVKDTLEKFFFYRS